MQADHRDPGVLAQGGEPSADLGRVQWFFPAAEDERVVEVDPAAPVMGEDGATLNSLQRSVVVVSRNTVRSPASLFGRPTMSSPPTRVIARWIFTDLSLEVEVTPLQGDRLAASDPCQQHYPVQQPEGSSCVARRNFGLVLGPHHRPVPDVFGSSTVAAGLRVISPLFTAVPTRLQGGEDPALGLGGDRPSAGLRGPLETVQDLLDVPGPQFGELKAPSSGCTPDRCVWVVAGCWSAQPLLPAATG